MFTVVLHSKLNLCTKSYLHSELDVANKPLYALRLEDFPQEEGVDAALEAFDPRLYNVWHIFHCEACYAAFVSTSCSALLCSSVS